MIRTDGRSPWRYLLPAFLLAGALLSVPGLHAAQDETDAAAAAGDDAAAPAAQPEPDASAATGSAATGGAADSPAGPTGSGRQGRRSDDVFRPSEEISEDLAVSYPVDI